MWRQNCSGCVGTGMWLNGQKGGGENNICQKHVFIMNNAPPRGFTITQGFADDLSEVGITNVHILNPAGT